jgi:uncharacterized protein (DUF1810 family)
MAMHYGIQDLGHASAYLHHPVLGARLMECTRLMNAQEGKSAYDILGNPDEMKFRSSMTLFKSAHTTDGVFAAALDKYFAGEEDELTLAKLGLAR